MRRRLPIFLFALAVPFAQAALAQEPPKTVESGSDIDRLPAQLDTFVQDAIREGLLTPAAPAGTGPESGPRQLTPPSQPSASEAAPPPAPVKVSLRPRQDEITQSRCPAVSPFDFSEFQDFSDYEDLMSWRKVLEAEETPTSDALMAKAYLVLGLNEEARMQLHGAADPVSDATRQLARLMEGRTRPNVDWFQHMADCHASTELWLALAKLRANDVAGAALLKTHLKNYEELPLQLRAAYAASAVPALVRIDQLMLAEQILKTFEEQDFDEISQLQFVQQIVALERGDSEAGNFLRASFNRGYFRDDAAAALRRHDIHLDDEFEAEFVTRLVDEYGELPSDIPVEASLDILMRDLNEAADYRMTKQLALLPAAQSEEAQARLSSHYADLVRHDLDSPDRLQNLKGMDALLTSGGLFDGRDDKIALYQEAIRIASEAGLLSMAERLSAHLPAEAPAPPEQVSHAKSPDKTEMR